jgi:hypothetical protein
MKFQKIVTEINNAFFRLESFMNGTIMDYQYFGFKEAFINLFTEARKHENFNYDNCKLIGKYFQLTEQIRIDTDKGDYENCEIAIDNKMFCKDCNEILYLNWERIEDFEEFSTPDEITESERKYSITDILKAPVLPPQPKTKADILKEKLSQYGFFELEKVKTLSEQSRVSIIEKIAESGLPYAIAMFDYLQFIPYLEKKHFDRKYKLNREVSKWFDSDKDGRAVKGNISSLLKNTTENKDRYTAYKHKENVIKDYELLK